MRLLFVLVLMAVSPILSAQEGSRNFSSGNQAVLLVELYTSQGCSSTPPAVSWINTLENDARLWKDFVPVAFHVDYWDKLGWVDPFSENAFSQRQRDYKRFGYTKTVGTPAVLLNGSYWNQWRYNQEIPNIEQGVGNLSGTLEGKNLTVNYDGIEMTDLYVAIMGSGAVTDVKRGENRGRVFTDNFVVLELKRYSSNDSSWKINLDDVDTLNHNKLSIALWVTKKNDLKPIQATGSWISF